LVLPLGDRDSFAIPCCDGKLIIGYVYTKLAKTPQTGRTLTINYTVTGDNPVWVRPSAANVCKT
jgi:hypothetical protein